MYNLRRINVRRNNLKKPLFIAKKIESEIDEYGNEIPMYDEPIPYSFNVMPVTSVSTNSEVQSFGELATGMRVAVITEIEKYIGKFKEFDLVYFDGVTPEGENVNGENANYVIYAVQPQNAILKIYFKKIIENQ